MTTPDVYDALTDYLRQCHDVTDLASVRIFPRELPASEAVSMPRAAIVLVPSGGLGGNDTVSLMSPRVDITAYAATPKQAFLLYLAAFEALRALSRKTHAHALLSSAIQGGGPLQMRDADTAWPFVWSSWTLFASTVYIA